MKKLLLILLASIVQQGYAQFSDPVNIEANTNLINHIVPADLNNDGATDLLIVKKLSTNIITYYINDGEGNYDTETALDAGSTIYTQLAVADFNNDGYDDLVSIGDANNDITLFTNNNLTFTAEVLDNWFFFDSDITTADLDNDNDIDIIAVAGSTIKVFYNDGNANFTIEEISHPNLEDFIEITTTDIDADGYLDIVTGGSNTSVYKNTEGEIAYHADLSSSSINQSDSFFIRGADVDGDGDTDLIIADHINNGIRWYANDGTTNFTTSEIISDSGFQIRNGTVADFNNDGAVDVMVSENFNVVLYTNDGSGNFTATTLQDTDNVISEVTTTDINNDTLPDIVWSQDLSYQLNNTVLSTETPTAIANISIYPNPSNGQLYINTPKAANLTVYNVQGQQVAANISLAQGKQLVQLQLPPQLYLLQLQTATGKYTQKLQIQ